MSNKEKSKPETSQITETFGRTTPTPSNSLKPKENKPKTDE